MRLSVNGQIMTQPIRVKMDPRVKITPGVQRIFTLTEQIENEAAIAASARKEAHDWMAKLKARPRLAGNDPLLRRLEEIAPEKVSSSAQAEARGSAPEREAPSPTLTDIAGRLIGSVMPMQIAEMPPTAAELAACAKQQAAYAALMAKWAALKAELIKAEATK